MMMIAAAEVRHKFVAKCMEPLMLVLDHAHHKHSYSTNPPGFIVYRKLKTWLRLLSILGWNMWTTVFCFVQRKQSKAKQSKQAIIWEWAFQFSDQYKHSCDCTPLLFAGLSARSEPKKWAFLVQNKKLFSKGDPRPSKSWNGLALDCYNSNVFTTRRVVFVGT